PWVIHIVIHISAGPSHASSDDPGQVLYLAKRGVALTHLVLDLLDPVQDGRVVAAPEDLTDLHQRQARAFAHQVHRDVAGLGERAGAGLRYEIPGRQREVLGRLLHDQLWGDLVVGLRDQVLQRALGQLLVDDLRGELGPGDDP